MNETELNVLATVLKGNHIRMKGEIVSTIYSSTGPCLKISLGNTINIKKQNILIRADPLQRIICSFLFCYDYSVKQVHQILLVTVILRQGFFRIYNIECDGKRSL